MFVDVDCAEPTLVVSGMKFVYATPILEGPD